MFYDEKLMVLGFENTKRLKIFGKSSIKDKKLSEAVIKSDASKYPIDPKNLWYILFLR